MAKKAEVTDTLAQDEALYLIHCGLPIDVCQQCRARVVKVSGVLVSYPVDGKVIGKMFPEHRCGGKEEK